MQLHALPFDEENLEYIIEKGKKKAVIIKLEDFKKLLNLINTDDFGLDDAAQSLCELILEFERESCPASSAVKNISSQYKEHLYGQDGLLK